MPAKPALSTTSKWYSAVADQGAWQSATNLCGYELLGKYFGMFTDKIAIGVDNKIIQQLERDG